MTSKVASPWGAPKASPWGANSAAQPAKPLSLNEVMRAEQDQQDWERSVRLAADLERLEIEQIVGPEEEVVDVPAAPEATESTEDDTDFAIALALQRQFNEEHDSYINEAETRLNGQHGRVRLSMDRYRAAYPEESTNVGLQSRRLGADDADSADEDEMFNDEPLEYHRGTRTMRNPAGEIVTKHDAERASNRNKNRMCDTLPLSFPCGDMRKVGGKGARGKDGRVPTHVFNRLQSFANKTEKERLRVTERKDTSTSDMAIDTKTRLILFRMINGKILDQVNGAISTGKEAVVFHANRHADPDDASSAVVEVALKVFKTTLTEFKQRQQFLHGDRRFESRVGRQSARKLVKLWAEKESANLVRMAHAGVPCPEMILQHKHVLLLGFIGEDGVAAPKLKDARLSETARKSALDQTREALVTMYRNCKLVHADLSEYNLLYYRKKVIVIDVGQAVETSHPRAQEFLFRDCVNVCRFFEKIGEPSTPTPHALYQEVTGQTISEEEAAQYRESINSSRQAPKQKLANTEAYMLGLCDLSDAADPGPAFRDPFASGIAAAAAAGDGPLEGLGDDESSNDSSEEGAEALLAQVNTGTSPGVDENKAARCTPEGPQLAADGSGNAAQT